MGITSHAWAQANPTPAVHFMALKGGRVTANGCGSEPNEAGSNPPTLAGCMPGGLPAGSLAGPWSCARCLTEGSASSELAPGPCNALSYPHPGDGRRGAGSHWKAECGGVSACSL